MEVVYTDKATEDLAHWKKTNDVKIQQRITSLILSIEESPFVGIGKPEALKHNLSGKWSRRINREHRIIYEITEGLIVVHSLKGHY